MLPTAIIVFREVLEAALIVGIVMAASRGPCGCGPWVSGGIAAGVIGAHLVPMPPIEPEIAVQRKHFSGAVNFRKPDETCIG